MIYFYLIHFDPAQSFFLCVPDPSQWFQHLFPTCVGLTVLHGVRLALLHFLKGGITFPMWEKF